LLWNTFNPVFVPVCNFQEEYIKTAAVMIAENKKMNVKSRKTGAYI
jgi:hypothetical protein